MILKSFITFQKKIILIIVISTLDIISGLSFMIMYLESLTKMIDTRLDMIMAIANS